MAVIFAALLLLAVGLAHSVLGERLILRRLDRQSLPPLRGSGGVTKRVLRFAWHVTTLAWWGFAALLLARFASVEASLQIVAATFAVTAAVIATSSRGRHPAWLVFLAVAVLSWTAS